jgi:hypothetical protein
MSLVWLVIGSCLVLFLLFCFWMLRRGDKSPNLKALTTQYNVLLAERRKLLDLERTALRNHDFKTVENVKIALTLTERDLYKIRRFVEKTWGIKLPRSDRPEPACSRHSWL